MKDAPVVQRHRTPPRHGGGRGFESRPTHCSSDNSDGRVPASQAGDVGSIPTHCSDRREAVVAQFGRAAAS